MRGKMQWQNCIQEKLVCDKLTAPILPAPHFSAYGKQPKRLDIESERVIKIDFRFMYRFTNS